MAQPHECGQTLSTTERTHVMLPASKVRAQEGEDPPMSSDNTRANGEPSIGSRLPCRPEGHTRDQVVHLFQVWEHPQPDEPREMRAVGSLCLAFHECVV